MDIYSTFKTLERHEREGDDYRIRWRIGTSGIAILSIHGGDIEPGTTRIANAIAGWQHSFYAFEGIKASGNRVLHITSTRFDEPIAIEIVCRSEIIVSIHGSVAAMPMVQLGGLDEEINRQITRELSAARFQVLACGKLPLGGTDQKNICNLCGRGMGVQMEISRGLRAAMFRDLTPEGRRHQSVVFARFTDAVRKALDPFAAAQTGAAPLRNTD